MVHPIIVGVCRRTGYFNQPRVKLEACHWGRIGAGHLVCVQCVHLRCSLLKGGNSLQAPLILVLPVLGLHIDIDQLKGEATP